MENTNRTVSIPVSTYQNLVACRTLLDMIMECPKQKNSDDLVIMIIRIAVKLRKLYQDALFIESTNDDDVAGLTF